MCIACDCRVFLGSLVQDKDPDENGNRVHGYASGLVEMFLTDELDVRVLVQEVDDEGWVVNEVTRSHHEIEISPIH